MNAEHDPAAQTNAPAPAKVGLVQEYREALASFSPSLRRFFIASPMVTMVVFGISAVLQNLFVLRLGFDARFIGLMLGFGQLVWAASALPAGLISNRIGLRNGIMAGYAAVSLGLALILLVESQPQALWRAWLMAGQGLLMLGAAFITVNIPPYLMAVTGERERRYAFAVFQAIIPASAFVGSLLAGLLPGRFAVWFGLSLDQPDPYRLTLWIGPVLLFAAILPLLGADPVKVAGRGAQQARTSRRPAAGWSFSACLSLYKSSATASCAPSSMSI
jgi:MFS family permease